VTGVTYLEIMKIIKLNPVTVDIGCKTLGSH